MQLSTAAVSQAGRMTLLKPKANKRIKMLLSCYLCFFYARCWSINRGNCASGLFMERKKSLVTAAAADAASIQCKVFARLLNAGSIFIFVLLTHHYAMKISFASRSGFAGKNYFVI